MVNRKIASKFWIDDIVFLLTDTDQCKRLVSAVQVETGGTISYLLICGTSRSWHYENEITDVMSFL